MPTIELRNISNYVFSNLNMKVFDGELLVVLGPNGAGKLLCLILQDWLITKEQFFLMVSQLIKQLQMSGRLATYSRIWHCFLTSMSLLMSVTA